MSTRELTRVEIMQRLVDKRLNQAQAANMIGLSILRKRGHFYFALTENNSTVGQECFSL